MNVPKGRGALAREKERRGEIKFEIVANHGTRKDLEYLTAMKNIVSKHLPNMALDYISRIVYDIAYHESLLMIETKSNNLLGGICFRPFPDRGFVEIVFCAIDITQQYQGYGSYLMQHFKKEMNKRAIYHILTYADNHAMEYFIKQGFRKNITLAKEMWGGYIKDYVAATLMECVLHKNVSDYTNVPATVKKQQECIQQLINEVSHSQIFKGLDVFKNGAKKIDIKDIPGVTEADLLLENQPENNLNFIPIEKKEGK